jgi:hypothetical protein
MWEYTWEPELHARLWTLRMKKTVVFCWWPQAAKVYSCGPRMTTSSQASQKQSTRFLHFSAENHAHVRAASMQQQNKNWKGCNPQASFIPSGRSGWSNGVHNVLAAPRSPFVRALTSFSTSCSKSMKLYDEHAEWKVLQEENIRYKRIN